MSKLKTNALQLGDNATATQNFTLRTNNDGTATLARGNVGATTQDILTIGADDRVLFPASPGILSKHYTSPAQSFVASGSSVLPHLLGVRPLLLQLTIKCLTIEHGYAVGDELYVPVLDDNSIGVQGCSVVADATNMTIRFGAGFYVVPHKTSGARTGLTAANWAVYVRAWA